MSTWRLLQGHVLDVLPTLPDESVHCVVTSPPYWALRDYALPPVVWGGDPACDHEWGAQLRFHKGGPHGPNGTLEGKSVAREQALVKDFDAGRWCQRCGAWRGQLGLEPTPELYLEHMVLVFREVWRVLRPDGTLWLNMGDTYTGGGRGGNGDTITGRGKNASQLAHATPRGLRAKDLLLLPARLALALQADGWWLRSDIIWHKPNPMPESVEDRPTLAHEHVFLLSKASRYFYDRTAIAEPASGAHSRGKGVHPKARVPTGWDTGGGGHRTLRGRYTPKQNDSFSAAVRHPVADRNARSVWKIASRAYPGAHFATFPPALAERCVRAGTSARGACPSCGAPWRRVVDKESFTAPVAERTGRPSHNGQPPQQSGWYWQPADVRLAGWYPTCRCYGVPELPRYPRRPRAKAERDAWREACAVVQAERERLLKHAEQLATVPCLVLDTFGGSGTTGAVAVGNGRDALLIELSAEYPELARERCGPLLEAQG